MAEKRKSACVFSGRVAFEQLLAVLKIAADLKKDVPGRKLIIRPKSVTDGRHTGLGAGRGPGLCRRTLKRYGTIHS